MREMKDSGIDWIGTIPQDWQLSKIGNLYTQRNEKVSDKDYQPLSVTMQGILPQLATAAKTDDGDNRKLVRVGDFAINSRSDRRGSCGISPLDGSVSLINIILTPRTAMHPVYYNWLFHTTLFADEFYKWGHGIVADLWTTRWQEMKSITVPVPEYAEQERIAAFLDAECAEIDAVLEKTRASIEEYKKLKQAVITQAVTKGIRGDRPMKDSGIEWIGAIQKDWGSNTIAQLCSQVKCKNTKLQEKNLLSLSYGKVKRKSIDTVEGLLPESFDGYNIIEKDDIVLRLTDLQNDHTSLRVGLAEERGIITSAYLTIRNRSNICTKYLYYYLHSFDIAKGFYGMGAGVRQGLNWDGVKWLKVLVPSVSEQEHIVAFLDAESEKLDELIAKKQQYLTEIENYKKSLIYEYVTGKKEVKTSVLAD